MGCWLCGWLCGLSAPAVHPRRPFTPHFYDVIALLIGKEVVIQVHPWLQKASGCRGQHTGSQSEPAGAPGGTAALLNVRRQKHVAVSPSTRGPRSMETVTRRLRCPCLRQIQRPPAPPPGARRREGALPRAAPGRNAAATCRGATAEAPGDGGRGWRELFGQARLGEVCPALRGSSCGGLTNGEGL